MRNKNTFILFFILLVSLDILVWRTIILAKSPDNLEIYFLNVGQGDSELVILPGGVQVLIDGGGNNRVLQNLASVLPFFDRYLDLVLLSHAEPDHYLGLIEVLKNYKVGAFIFNGLDGIADSWPALTKILNDNKISTLVLGAGDKISYQESHFDILSPTKDFLNENNRNDSSLVMKLVSLNSETLFTGDISKKLEDYLVRTSDLKADILKVAHHGSKYSSSQNFLGKTLPQIAVIEVGKNNYGHPTKEVLERLASVGAQIYRTDTDGTLKFIISPSFSKIQVFKKK
jgi:competence protein ComEC